ncbi:MAG: tRNA (adenosine(37)-N6)-threonylcarbamoyltransferase complex ATPase subunit type 1 TsaE [Candidatus Saccharimonadales bacterium]
MELVSDLGGGKTTFVRGLANGLKSKNTVTSPTFTLQNIYQGRGDLEIHHFDFYRLTDPGVLAAQLVESIGNPNVITVIEWSHIVKGVLPADRLSIEFQPTATSPDERLLTIAYPGSQSVLITKVESQWQNSRP